MQRQHGMLMANMTCEWKCIEFTTYIKHPAAGIHEEQLNVQEMVQNGRVAVYAILIKIPTLVCVIN